MADVSEIAALLRDRAEDVARRYCDRGGAYVERGQFYALNPGRADRSVGSFFVTLHGPFQGRWRDMATGQQGDMLDLIGMALGCDRAGAIAEARAFLGLRDAGPPDAARLRARRQAHEEQAAARRDEEGDAARRREGAARRIWMIEARALEPGDPVDLYLRGRGLDLRELPRAPNAIRHHPALAWRSVDPETGEVLDGRAPAMVTAVTAPDGRMVAAHRVWLEQRDGRWRKLSIPKPKKVLGRFGGAAARVWRGVGADGKPLPRLADAPPGSAAVICEGVEDALAVALLRPDLRVLAAISLGNMGAVGLPPAIETVTLAADNDDHPQAREALLRGIETHRAAGRVVRVARSAAGKDFADWVLALRAGGAWGDAA